MARKRPLPGRPVLAENYLPPAHNLNQWSELERGQTVVERQKKSRGNLSVPMGVPPYPPSIFLNFADYMNYHGINNFRSSSGKILPHREIGPLEITPKCSLFRQKTAPNAGFPIRLLGVVPGCQHFSRNPP